MVKKSSEIVSQKLTIKPMVRFVGFLLALMLNTFIITWIDKLNKIECECSKDWKTPYIKFWAYFSIGFSLLSFIVNVFYTFEYTGIMVVFTSIIGLISIMNVIALLTYIYNLKKIECECSEDKRREFIYIYLWIFVSIMAFSFFMIGFGSGL